MEIFILLCILVMTYAMLFAKRISALIRTFSYQSFFLFLITLLGAINAKSAELYVVAMLLLGLKVIMIPYFLQYIADKIKVSEDLGLFVNSQLSIICGLVITYISWIFSKLLMPAQHEVGGIVFTVSFAVTLMGLFIMVFRMKAISQILGLLVMENGLFLLALMISGGMPFFVEIAIFFDLFVTVTILGLFVYRINKLFTHIDVDKLSRLKG